MSRPTVFGRFNENIFTEWLHQMSSRCYATVSRWRMFEGFLCHGRAWFGDRHSLYVPDVDGASLSYRQPCRQPDENTRHRPARLINYCHPDSITVIALMSCTTYLFMFVVFMWSRNKLSLRYRENPAIVSMIFVKYTRLHSDVSER